MVIETAAIAITEGAGLLSQIYPIFAKNSGQHASASAVLTRLEGYARKRTILGEGGEDPDFNHAALMDSPVLECFQNLYFDSEPAANYVLFAPPSTGKTTAARAMLKWVMEWFDGNVKPVR